MKSRDNGIRSVLMRLIFLLLFIGIGIWNTGFAFAQNSIRIASTQGLYSGILFIADQKGFFSEQGVGVEIVTASSGIAATEMLMEGTADFIMLTEMAAANSIMAGKNLAILASTAEFDNSEIIARKDRGIMEPSDLRGKRIGLVFGSSVEYFLLSFFASHGLGMDDAEVVHIPANLLIEALASGQVDAIATWSPHTHRAVEKMGANGVHWPIQGIQKKFWLLAGLHEELPPMQTMQQLIKSLIEAELFIQENEAEAKALLQEYLEAPQKDLADDWDKIRFRVVLPRELLSTMEFQIKWKLAQEDASFGEIKDFLDNMLFGALEAERPESVTIMH